MQKTKASYLLHPLFLGSLVVLLLNDFHWKYEYHNWVTGKLSDLAGMVVLPVFLLAFFPQWRKQVLLFTAFFFLWWKSPFSEPLIQFLWTHTSLPVQRVIDYTDLLAVGMLPVVFRLQPVSYKIGTLAQSCFRLTAGFLAFISLCSTSMVQRGGLYAGYRENRASFFESFESPKSEDQIIDHLQSKGFAVSKERFRFLPVLNGNNLYYRIKSANDTLVQWLPVPHSTDSSFYIRRETGTFYLLPQAVVNGDSLKNIEFTIYNTRRKKKQSSVTIESFETKTPEKYTAMKRKERRGLKKKFEALLSD